MIQISNTTDEIKKESLVGYIMDVYGVSREHALYALRESNTTKMDELTKWIDENTEW